MTGSLALAILIGAFALFVAFRLGVVLERDRWTRLGRAAFAKRGEHARRDLFHWGW